MTEFFSAVSQKENGTKYAGDVIRRGGLVAFPTETVYGLGANGLDGEAVKRIFEAKGRPQDNPLIMHVARKSDAAKLWRKVNPQMQQLMDVFWPGPLSIISTRSPIVPDEVTAGLDTVAVRMPDNKTALAFIRAAGVPIAAPSANISGRPSGTTARHVMDDFDGRIDVVLDGGACRVGLESTVISMLGRPTVLRPGGVTREMLESVLGPVELSPAVLGQLKAGETAMSPGMKYTHYKPDCRVIVALGGPERAARAISAAYEIEEIKGSKCVIFSSKQTKGFYHGKTCDIIGDRSEPETLCANLFSALRRYSGKADVIFAEAVSETSLGLAYMNRLLRAAGFETI